MALYASGVDSVSFIVVIIDSSMLLEELGYLEKTHTSSGRIPTEKGYRLYVEELMNIDDVQEELDEQVAQYFENSKISSNLL